MEVEVLQAVRDHTQAIMFGQTTCEVEVNVPASEAWELYSTPKLRDLIKQKLPNWFDNIELLKGDGGFGSVYRLTFPPGSIPASYTERFTKVDNKNRVKEGEIFEGGYLEIGFTKFIIRHEVKEKGDDKCIIKSSYVYELKEEAVDKASIVDIAPVAVLDLIARDHLEKKQT